MKLYYSHLVPLVMWLAASASAQPGPGPTVDAMPMADYLGLLEQIAPAARAGAQAYLHAHRQRCGRQLATSELRRAFSEAGGDPVLMAMIRATQFRDEPALASLSQRLRCGERS